MPSGHVGILMPQRMYFIDQATAVLDNEDLGQAVRISPNPQIGQVPLPARGVLAVGQAAWAILGNDERALTPRKATERPGGWPSAGRPSSRPLVRMGAATELISAKAREFPPVARGINR
jgi:hypothetical protein